MIMTMQDKFVYDKSTLRRICKEELAKDRVRDNCYRSRKFRGAAYEVCNLKYKVPKLFPVLFQNLSGYDSHLFIKTLGNREGYISCIPSNDENYNSFTKQVIVDKFVNKEGREINVKRELIFISSLRCMAASLDKLSSNLKIGELLTGRNTIMVVSYYYNGSQLSLLLRKGVYSYD